MTRQLANLADIAYRRRGRMVLAWIAATIVLIGLGSSFAGDFHADYNTPGSESKAASDITQRDFHGYSGQEIYVVWKDAAGASSATARRGIAAFLAEAEGIEHIGPATATRVSKDRTIATTTLPLTTAGWNVPKRDGEQLIAAAKRNSVGGLEIKLGENRSTPQRAQRAPRGLASWAPRSSF